MTECSASARTDAGFGGTSGQAICCVWRHELNRYFRSGCPCRRAVMLKMLSCKSRNGIPIQLAGKNAEQSENVSRQGNKRTLGIPAHHRALPTR